MKITIEKKTFELTFGFKCFMNLGKALGLKTFGEVASKFISLSSADNIDSSIDEDEENNDLDVIDEKDISFEMLELIEKLVIVAAESHPNYGNLGYSIHDVLVLDGIMAQPKLLGEIMSAFMDSFPKTEGKQQANPAVRKPSPKKKI